MGGRMMKPSVTENSQEEPQKAIEPYNLIPTKNHSIIKPILVNLKIISESNLREERINQGL